MSKDEALKLALEAFEWNYNTDLDNIPACEKWAKMLKENITAIKEALAQPEQCQCPNCKVTLHASDCAVHNEPAYPKGQCNCGAQPEQEPAAWKLVPKEPTDEMLKAMDECSTEGYDERLYAGHAASVYMAAVDVAPTPPQPSVSIEQEPTAFLCRGNLYFWPTKDDYCGNPEDHIPLYTTSPQRTWVGLTDEEAMQMYIDCGCMSELLDAIDAKLKEKNT